MADYLKPNAKTNALDKSAYTDFDLNLRAHPITGDITIKKDSDAIKRSVKNIILTNKFERPFKPNFGTGIRDMLFELDSSRKLRHTTKEIEKMLMILEPRINNVIVQIGEVVGNELNVTVFYNIINGIQNQNTTFTVTRVR